MKIKISILACDISSVYIFITSFYCPSMNENLNNLDASHCNLSTLHFPMSAQVSPRNRVCALCAAVQSQAWRTWLSSTHALRSPWNSSCSNYRSCSCSTATNSATSWLCGRFATTTALYQVRKQSHARDAITFLCRMHQAFIIGFLCICPII